MHNAAWGIQVCQRMEQAEEDAIITGAGQGGYGFFQCREPYYDYNADLRHLKDNKVKPRRN